jgi:hypothetical protein
MDQVVTPDAGLGLETGKAAVRALLLGRCDEAGLVRAKAVSEQKHADMRGRLVERLAYMTPENLMTLAEAVIDAAGQAMGVARGVWPAEVIIMGYAQGLQRAPLREQRIVTSWFASVEGPVAEAGGYVVELFRFLARHGRPPLPMDLRVIREEADANQRLCGIIRDRIARDACQPDQRAWFESYVTDLRTARGWIDQGNAKRAAGQAA